MRYAVFHDCQSGRHREQINMNYFQLFWNYMKRKQTIEDKVHEVHPDVNIAAIIVQESEVECDLDTE